MAQYIDNLTQNSGLLSMLGINPWSYQTAAGQSSQEWARRWVDPLAGLGGYYDQNYVNSLMNGLGASSSASYLGQLQILASESNKLYTLTQDPGMVAGLMNQAAQQNGGMLQFSLGGGWRIDQRSGVGYGYDMMGNRYDDITMSPLYSSLYSTFNDFSGLQQGIVEQLNAQQQREQSFVTQINQVVQQATLAKSQAEQAAAQKALLDQQAAAQAQLDAQAQANQQKLAQQEAQQKAQYDEAQRQVEANRVAQQTRLDETALLRTQQATQQATQEQVAQSVSQLEAQAVGSRGGEAVVSTNATSKPQRGQTTRTERWQSTRQPAPGGGGIRT